MKKTEPSQARRWREAASLSVAELADRTGYSIEAIYLFERGVTPERNYKNANYRKTDRTIKPHVWLRYKRACEGVNAELTLQQKFDW